MHTLPFHLIYNAAYAGDVIWNQSLHVSDEELQDDIEVPPNSNERDDFTAKQLFFTS